MFGQNFNLNNDAAILAIKSPKASVGGPYKVVYKNVSERWAIVALNWDGNPRLGIRWFTLKAGNPVSRRYPVWFILPVQLEAIILKELTLYEGLSHDAIKNFLAGIIPGSEL